MKLLMKHIIYEYALSVLFENIKKNLFSRINIVDFQHQYEQDVNQGVTYKLLVFADGGYIYKFDNVHVTKLTDRYIYFEFESALVINMMVDEEEYYAELWDTDDSPVSMDLDTLVESV